tara:strand:+ start:224 stop:529 length:306 start_codon:yes stop_codon:yes gene_type:complete
MRKKIIYILLVTFFLTSCGSLDEVGRGLTGAKKKSSDEFFIQKKDPLILPPDYENLPTPDERVTASEEFSIFEDTLGTSIEDSSSNSGSVEESILKKIKSK